MKTPNAQTLTWAIEATMPGAAVVEAIAMRDGGSPWLLRLRRDGAAVECVLREGEAPPLRTEAQALRVAADHGLPAPRLIAVDCEASTPAIVSSRLDGSSQIPARPGRRLRELGMLAARLHDIKRAPSEAMPLRTRPIPGVDFDDLRSVQPDPDPILAEAVARVAGGMPDEPHGLVHGDLWQGNTVWYGDRLSGLIDWDCAGVGPAGVDLGSLRCDAALCFGLDAADEVVAGWEDAAGRKAANVAYWDVIAALSTPPNMGWFVEALAGQGRDDLSRSRLLVRRAEFLRAALDRL